MTEASQTTTSSEGAKPDDAAQAGDQQQASSTETTQAAPERPEGLPDQFWDDAAGVKVGDLLNAYNQATAVPEGRPAEASGYELSIPEEYGNAEDIRKALQEDSAFLNSAREYLFSKGATQAEFDGLFKLYLKEAVGDPGAMEARKQAEMAKLGSRATDRISAVENWVKGKLGDAEFSALRPFISTADGIVALEKLIALVKAPPVPSDGGQQATNGADLSYEDRLRNHYEKTYSGA